MSVKIRIQRHCGKKGKPFYWVVAADARAKRDGRFLEHLGSYKPKQAGVSVDLYNDTTVKQPIVGAQITDIAKTVLTLKSALYKYELDRMVKRGKLTLEQADAKHNMWLEEKYNKIRNQNNTKNKALSSIKERDIQSNKIVAVEKGTVEVTENLMDLPYSTETKISIQNVDLNHLEKDKEYNFEMSVKIENDLDRQELLKSFGFVVSSPSFEVLGEPVVKLSFNKNIANTSFKVIPKSKGNITLNVNLLQNYKIIDQIEINTTVL